MDWQNFSSELEVGITSYCQAECPLCDRTYRIHNLRLLHLNKKDFTDICTDLPNVIKTIRICGDYGDPLMNPHLDEILDYLVFEKKLNFRIHTNGAIRKQEWFSDCAKYGDNCEFVFGIDGTTAEVNDIYRKKVDFDKAWNNMLACAKALPIGKVTWQFIVFPHNYHQIDDAKRLADKHNISLSFTVNTRPPFEDHEEPWILDQKKQKILVENYNAWMEYF